MKKSIILLTTIIISANASALSLNGYDKFGFDKKGYNQEGFNVFGYNEEGFDKDGCNYYDESKNKEGIDCSIEKLRFKETEDEEFREYQLKRSVEILMRYYHQKK